MSEQTKSLSFDPAIDPKNRKLDWSVIIFIALLHLLCLLCWHTFTWSGLAMFALFSWIGGGLGITLCFHRLLTHQSFKTPNWFKYFITLCGCIQWQGGPIRWVGTHRLHHRDSDQEADPHSPKHGFTWGHITWNLYKAHDDFKPYDAAKDLMRDKVMVFIDRWFFMPQFILAGILYGLGYLLGEGHLGFAAHASGGHFVGLSWVIWAICLRTVVAWHGTWFVNSAGHTWGYKNFKTTDDSRNTWWVALLSFGEGWHNNHHAFQRSAAHGLRWWEFDITYITIRFLSLVGLATDVVKPSAEQMVKRDLKEVARQEAEKKEEAAAAADAAGLVTPPAITGA